MTYRDLLNIINNMPLNMLDQPITLKDEWLEEEHHITEIHGTTLPIIKFNTDVDPDNPDEDELKEGIKDAIDKGEF